MARKRWKLPKTFKLAKVKKGAIQRSDGEPRVYRLTKHANDRSLSTHSFEVCCDCGLSHHITLNVIKAKKRWYLLERAYRVPGTGKGK